MSHTKNLRFKKSGILCEPPEGEPKYSLFFVGPEGSWLIVIWERIVEYPDGKYKESEKMFYNQRGELIATYSESFLIERKAAEEKELKP